MNKGSNTKLFKQWAKEAALPASAIPYDLQDRRPKGKAAPTSADTTIEYTPQDIQDRPVVNKGMIQLPVKYVFLMLATIAALLVTLSVLITIQLS